MAEHVQAALDQMVAPLRDLMDRNIFSEQEIKAIVERRRESEYLLRRLAARKADFLRYIEAEQTLERLRHLRTVQKKRDHRKKKVERQTTLNDNGATAESTKRKDDDSNTKHQQQHIGDVHIVKHIHLLFVRAIRKFRSDLSLHLAHAEFCKEQKSWTRLGRVYAEALQIFPRQSGLWIEAASHEFFGPTRSIRNARILLQRALRLNGTKEEGLWLQYFSLELHYAQTLKGRRQILMGDKPRDDDYDDDDDNGNQNDTEHVYKLPLIVFRNAIRAIPDSVHFRLRFMDTCKRFPQTEYLMEVIQDSMKEDFVSEPESWIARALYEAERNGKRSFDVQDGDDDDVEDDVNCDNSTDPPSKKTKMTDSVLAVLEEATEALANDEMFLQVFRFVQDYEKDLKQRETNEDAMGDVARFIGHLWGKANGHTSCDLALEHTNYLLNTGFPDKAIETIKDFCTLQKGDVTNARVWIRWASLVTEESEQRIILERALGALSVDRLDHFVILLQHFALQLANDEGESDETLYDSLQRLLLLAPKTRDDYELIEIIDSLATGTLQSCQFSNVFEASSAYLKHAMDKKGLVAARKVYTCVLFQSTVRLSESYVDTVQKLVDQCLKMEPDKKRRLRLYDKAMEIFDGTSLYEKYRADRNEKALFV